MKAKFIISKSTVLNKYHQIEKSCDMVSYSSKTNPLITSLLEENTDSIFSIHLFNELKDINYSLQRDREIILDNSFG